MPPLQPSISSHSPNLQDFSTVPGSLTRESPSSTSCSPSGNYLTGPPPSSECRSFDTCFYPHSAGSPAELLGPLDPIDFNFLRMSSIEESDDGFVNETALVMPKRQDDLDGSYKCCALNLADLHALVEHFEEYHVVVLDPYTRRPLLSTSSPLRPTVSNQLASHYSECNAVSSAALQQEPQLVGGEEQAQPITYQTVDTDDMKLSIHTTTYGVSPTLAPSASGMPLSNPLSGHSLSTSSLVASSTASPASPSLSTFPIAAFETTRDLSSRLHPNPHLHHPQPHLAYNRFDPGNMDLDVDPTVFWAPSSVAPSPSGLPLSDRLSGRCLSTSFLVASSAASPAPPSPSMSPIASFETTRDLSSRLHPNPHLHHPQPHLAYNRFDPGNMDLYVDPTVFWAPSATCSTSKSPSTCPVVVSDTTKVPPSLSSGDRSATCAPTSLLLSKSSGSTPDSSLPSSCVASPFPGRYGGSGYRENAQAPSLSSGASPGLYLSSINAAALQSGTKPQALKGQEESAWSLLRKPFRCPKATCNKSYKQLNGLKYHIAHGSCTSAPSKDLQKFQELLASKRSIKAAVTGEVELSKTDLMEVHQEVERKVRPFACGIGKCQRRYRNLNGLRYHYKTSDDHGAIGLQLLESGRHESQLCTNS